MHVSAVHDRRPVRRRRGGFSVERAASAHRDAAAPRRPSSAGSWSRCRSGSTGRGWSRTPTSTSTTTSAASRVPPPGRPGAARQPHRRPRRAQARPHASRSGSSGSSRASRTARWRCSPRSTTPIIDGVSGSELADRPPRPRADPPDAADPLDDRHGRAPCPSRLRAVRPAASATCSSRRGASRASPRQTVRQGLTFLRLPAARAGRRPSRSRRRARRSTPSSRRTVASRTRASRSTTSRRSRTPST